MSVNYNFLANIYAELSQDQKNKFKKLLGNEISNLEKTG